MAQSSVMLSVPQLVDLALNSPEMGVINFNMLHALLHVLVQQSDLAGCTVEFRGGNGEKIQGLLNSMKPAQAVTVTEYIINKDGTQVKKKEDTSPTDEETVVLVETVTESISTPHVSVAFSKSHLTHLQDDIQEIKLKVKELLELPSNLDLINASRDKSQPIVDMFQLLTLNKRITANEEGLTKMASMIEDLARSTEGIPLTPTRTDTESVQAGKPEKSEQPTSSFSSGQQGLITRLAYLEHLLGVTETGVLPEEQQINVCKEIENMKNFVNGLQQQLQTGGAGLSQIQEGEGGKGGEVSGATNKKIEECNANLQSLDAMFRKEMVDMQDQLNGIEQLVNTIVEKLKVGCSDSPTGSEISVADIQNKVTQVEGDMENLIEIVNKLIADKEGKDTKFNTINEEIELLKTVKADREDLEDALADKADACAVNRKVSHDQFDAACDDLSKGIEEALTKLTQQEQLWQQALDDIQKEIGNKLDKTELLPLRDFINNKLRLLQDKLKELSKLHKEAEAAGVKSKYLKDVNCISCDKNVVMRKKLDPSTLPKPYALPPGKSMAPYLAYELDNLRKQQKCFPHGRNLNEFEKAMNIPKGGEDHICNRYCGGSHTVTTPQQRVTRLGHFVQQWGPGVLPMGEGVIRGTDGQMYKSSDEKQSPKPRSSLVVQGDGVSPRKPSKGGEGVTSSKDAPSVTKEKRPSKRPSSEKPIRSSKGSLTKAQGSDVKPPSIRKASSAGSKRGSQASVKQEGVEALQTVEEVSEVDSKPPESVPEQPEGEENPKEEPIAPPSTAPTEEITETPAEDVPPPSQEGENAEDVPA